MCGIFGYCCKELDGVPTAVLDACRDTLEHRGPDSFGRFQGPGLYLGFRRLAILDVSAKGNQPMTSSDGRYTVVFNGEIYNFLELRRELERAGDRFLGGTDTEVLLKLYAQDGIRCLEKLNGMFAFGIYDKLERTLLLVRDRLGVKPLFYWQHAGHLGFASELRALRGLPGFPEGIDPVALGCYFRLGMVPEWTSIHPGVAKLRPGCWIRFHLDSGRLEGPFPYWDLPPVQEDSTKSEERWVDEIEELLWDATRIRLRADVPLGVFLSGGIDSGLVAAAAARQSSGLSSLTIGFAGEPEDETALALATARHLGLSPITRNVGLREGITALPGVMAHFDEPLSDTSALPTALVCREARREFTVVLSGDAGDEVFGGYPNHVRAWHWRHLERLPLCWRQAAGSLLASLSPRDSAPRRFCRRLAHPVGRFGMGAMLYPFQDWPQGCLRPELNLPPERLVLHYAEQLPSWSGATSIDLAQRMDLRSYLLEDILVKVDRMSMRHSLEVRSPFLDYRLVELGLRVPSQLRVKQGRNKYLLRKLAERHLPDHVGRAPKRGFAMPVQAWLPEILGAGALSAAGTNGTYPDPLLEGGAERVCRLARKNPAMISAVVQLLSYRWWCAAAAGSTADARSLGDL